MSDYSITADYDKHHQDQDWQAYLDSIEGDEEVITVPTCGMCVHFVSQRRFNAISDGREIISPSYCKLRASADLPPLRESITPAEDCPFYEFDCDF